MLNAPGSLDSVAEEAHHYGFNNYVVVFLDMQCADWAPDYGMSSGHQEWAEYYVRHNGAWKYIDSGW